MINKIKRKGTPKRKQSTKNRRLTPVTEFRERTITSYHKQICYWAFHITMPLDFWRCNIFTLCNFKLKLKWYVSTFFMYPETKIQFVLTKIPIDTIVKSLNSGNVMALPKLSGFTVGVYWKILRLLSDSTEISRLSRST